MGPRSGDVPRRIWAGLPEPGRPGSEGVGTEAGSLDPLRGRRCRGCRLPERPLEKPDHGHERSRPSGAIVREDCLKPHSLSVTEGARRLGVGKQTPSKLVNEKASVSIEMAYRLSKAFGSTPETWLGLQLAFDLARSRHLESVIKAERIAAA